MKTNNLTTPNQEPAYYLALFIEQKQEALEKMKYIENELAKMTETETTLCVGMRNRVTFYKSKISLLKVLIEEQKTLCSGRGKY